MRTLLPTWPLVVVLGLGGIPAFAAPKDNSAGVAAARAALARHVMLSDLPSQAAKTIPRLGALLHHLEKAEAYGTRVTLSQKGGERIEVGPASGMVTLLEGGGSRFSTIQDLERHGLGTPEALAARAEALVLETVDMPTHARGAEQLARADEKLAALTVRGQEALRFAATHPDHMLLAKHHHYAVAPRGKAPGDLVIKTDGSETLALRFNATNNPPYAQLVLHSGAGGSTASPGAPGYASLMRLQLGVPARYDEHLQRLLLSTADLAGSPPTPENLDRARHTLQRRIDEANRLAKMGETMYDFSPHLHHGLRVLAETLDKPTHWAHKARATIAADDSERIVFVGQSHRVGEGQLMVESGPEDAPTSSRPAKLADLERHALGTMEALDRAVEAVAVARLAGSHDAAAKASALAEYRARVKFSQLEIDGQIHDADVSALVRDHVAHDPAAGPLRLAGEGERGLYADPGVVEGTASLTLYRDAYAGGASMVPLKFNGIKTLREFDELVGRRLLEAAALHGDPMDAGLRAAARKKLEERAARANQAIAAVSSSPDLQLLSMHRRVGLLGAPASSLGTQWLDAFAIAQDERGVLVFEHGRLHYVSHDTLRSYEPKIDGQTGALSLEGKGSGFPLFGQQGSVSTVGSAHLRILGAEDPTQVQARIEHLVLDRAGMKGAPVTAENLAMARGILQQQITDATALAQVLRTGHPDARLLIDYARSARRSSPHQAQTVDLKSQNGKTLRASGYGTGNVTFAVDNDVASIGALREFGIRSPADLDELLHHALLSAAARVAPR